MTQASPPEEQRCPDCQGRTIEFKGKGLESQYRICPRWTEPGHLTSQEVQARLFRYMQSVRPSGRWA